MTKNIDKPLALIHVDIDSLWTINQDFGQSINRNDNIAYEESIPRFLEIFDTEKFKKADFNSENIYASKGNTFFL